MTVPCHFIFYISVSTLEYFREQRYRRGFHDENPSCSPKFRLAVK